MPGREVQLLLVAASQSFVEHGAFVVSGNQIEEGEADVREKRVSAAAVVVMQEQSVTPRQLEERVHGIDDAVGGGRYAERHVVGVGRTAGRTVRCEGVVDGGATEVVKALEGQSGGGFAGRRVVGDRVRKRAAAVYVSDGEYVKLGLGHREAVQVQSLATLEVKACDESDVPVAERTGVVDEYWVRVRSKSAEERRGGAHRIAAPEAETPARDGVVAVQIGKENHPPLRIDENVAWG